MEPGIVAPQWDESEIKVYKYRWVILALYVMACVVNFIQQLEFTIIINIVTKYYEVDEFLVNMTNLIFFIIYIAIFYPVSFLIEKHSLKYTMITSLGLTVIGNLLKLLATKPGTFWVILVSQGLIGIGQVYLGSIPPKIATTWFGSEEVSTASAIGVFGIQLGASLACIQSPYLVSEDGDPQPGFLLMFIIQAVASVVVLIFVIFFFRATPDLPPSQSQWNLRHHDEGPILTFSKDMIELLKNKNFWLILWSLGLANGIWNAFGVIQTTVYTHYFPKGEKDAGNIGLMTILIGGCVSTTIFGYILDKTHRFKTMSVCLLACSALSYFGIAASLICKSRLATYFAIPTFGFFIAPTMLVAFEYLVEITYPIPEACSSSIFIAFYSGLAVALTYILEALNDSIGYLQTFVVSIALLIVSTVVMFFVNAELRRRNANLRHRNLHLTKEAEAMGSSDSRKTFGL